MIRRLKDIATPLFYSVVASTVLRGVKRGSLGGVLVIALLSAGPTAKAGAGEYQVATCQADRLHFGLAGFTDFAHRGMMIRRACNPKGPGMRGLFVSNVKRDGRVKRGSIAELVFNAPPGTRITSLSWYGGFRRRDCRYALQMWADAPDITRKVLENAGANRRCPKPRLAQFAYWKHKPYAIPAATRIVQRVVCVGDKQRNWCSGRNLNYIRTYEATVTLVDAIPPTVEILQDTPLATGAWVGGEQLLNYTASDNVGVRSARVLIGGREQGADNRVCLLALPEGPFAHPQPCPNGPGSIETGTLEIAEGTQQLLIEVQDSAGNRTSSTPVTAHIDNAPPGRVDVSVEGGDAWRNRNEWAVVWSNPAEGDRAPIVAANYDICAAGGKPCASGKLSAPNVSRLPLTVPSPGEWTVSLWRTDAAGNGETDNASVPVTLRYDPDPPQLEFEPGDVADPTQVAVRVNDAVSGLAGGSIEIGDTGTGVWQTLTTQQDGSRLVARIDDAALPAGTYVLRARAHDHAGNEASTDRRGDGQPMVVTLPLRSPVTIRAGFETEVQRAGSRRPTVVLRPSARVVFGKRVAIAGRITTRDGRPIAGAALQLITVTGEGAEQLAGTLTSGANGHFRTIVTGSSSRTLRLVYGGSSVTLPSHRALEMRVPAATSVRVSRRRVKNGQRVSFSGRVRGLPVPAAGKLVEVQVRFSDGWQTFRTTRSDQAGRWSSRYRFQRTRGVQRYRFRIRLAQEGGYPFETGISRIFAIEVRGS